MDPITTVTTGWTLLKEAGEISQKLGQLYNKVKDREAKHEIDQILDRVAGLKQQASKLEDENRELRERLRFKSEDFEFKNPFWFEKAHQDRPLCPKCFAKGTIAPTTEQYQNVSGGMFHRRCLHCATEFDFGERTPLGASQNSPRGGGGPNSWMR